MNNNPLVSIISPCYNQAPYMAEMMESVLRQTYQNWECVLVNDGSTDNTEEIALDWCSKDARFKYISKENSGVSDTRNYGIAQSEGELILPLDADDKIAPEYLAEAVKIFVGDQKTKLVYCNSYVFGDVDQKEIPSQEYEFEKNLWGNLIHNSSMFRKSDFLNSEGYNPNMKEGLEDWDFLLGFLHLEDKVVKLEQYLFYYRIKQISRSAQIDREKNEKLILQMFKNHTELYLRFMNPIRIKLECEEYKHLLESCRGSKEYKIGSFFCTPFNLVKKAFGKLSS